MRGESDRICIRWAGSVTLHALYYPTLAGDHGFEVAEIVLSCRLGMVAHPTHIDLLPMRDKTTIAAGSDKWPHRQYPFANHRRTKPGPTLSLGPVCEQQR